MAAEELKYFFSYARADSESVLRLAKELRAVGANLWLDQLDILPGQHWDRTVEEALKNCKGMIAVLSPDSVASDNVMDEVSYALNQKKLVVPILLRSCSIPLRMQRLQYADFTTDHDAGFSHLLRALGIEQPEKPVESTAAQEPVVQDSTPPPKAKSTEPPAQAEQAGQGAEEPLSARVSEPMSDELSQPRAVGPQTEMAESKSQRAKIVAAICIVAAIAIVSTGVYFKYVRPGTCGLRVTSAGGSVTKSPDQSEYNLGEKVTLEAMPNTGYRFTNWSGDLAPDTNDANNVIRLVMNADKSVTANFLDLRVETRQAIVDMEKETLERLYKTSPGTKDKIAKAAGYGTFANANVNLILASAGGGYGSVVDNSTGKRTYMKMAMGGIGLGLGPKDYRVVMIFKDKAALDKFIKSGWDSGAHGEGDIRAGIEFFTMTEFGLALQATIAGTKYWKDDSLN